MKSRSGYTIIELLVVVAIMAITAGTLVSFNRLGQDQVTMYVEASKIVDVILRAKSLAISAYRDPGETRVTCAHGISINISSNPGVFSLNRYFKKQPGGATTPTPCADIGKTGATVGQYDRAVAESSTYALSQGIVFDEVDTTVSDIIFRPPDPELFFFGQDGSMSSARTGSIVIKNSSNGDKIRIVVGQGGQITYNFVD